MCDEQCDANGLSLLPVLRVFIHTFLLSFFYPSLWSLFSKKRRTRIESASLVQCYFLSGVADCFTDFHIDFGGSSVYYQVLEGTAHCIGDCLVCANISQNIFLCA
jgi:hypothetical protein